MPKATDTANNGIDAFVDQLLERASATGSVTEDEIQIVLKDVDVSDADLTGIYRSLRDRGIDIVSQGDDEADAGIGADDDDAVLGGDLDDDEFVDDDIRAAKNARRRDGLHRQAQAQVARAHDAVPARACVASMPPRSCSRATRCACT